MDYYAHVFKLSIIYIKLVTVLVASVSGNAIDKPAALSNSSLQASKHGYNENSVYRNITITAYGGVNLPDAIERTTIHPKKSSLNVQASALDRPVIEKANEKQFQLLVPSFSFISVLLVFGLPGNVIAIMVYGTKLKKAVARYFILTLAVSDLLTCVVAMPMELVIMTRYFDFDMPVFCKIFRFMAYFSNNLSSLTLVAIALERHRIICTPWKQKFTTKMSRKICYLNMLIAAVTAFPMIVMYGTHTIPLKHLNVSATVSKIHNASYSTDDHIRVVTDNTTVSAFKEHIVYGTTCSISDTMVGSTFPFYMLSVYISATVLLYIVLSVLYGRIARSLFGRRKDSMSEHNQRNTFLRARQVTVMGFALTISYQLCYLPCLTLAIVVLSNPKFYASVSSSGKMVYFALSKSYVMNGSLNPFIYCVFNKDVRQQLYQHWTLLRGCQAYKDTGVS